MAPYVSTLGRMYKQTKKKAIKSNSTSSKPTKRSRKKSISDVLPQDDYDLKEKTLTQFDMNIAYGPSIGISRLKRWERAKALSLNTSQEVFDLLKSYQVQQQSLWQKIAN